MRAGCMVAWSARASRACCLPTMLRPFEREWKKQGREKKEEVEKGRERRKGKAQCHLIFIAAFSWFYTCSLICPVNAHPPLLFASLLCSHHSALQPQIHYLSVCPLAFVSLPACLFLCVLKSVSVWLSVICFIFSPILVSLLCCYKWKLKVLKDKLAVHCSMSGVMPCHTAPS